MECERKMIYFSTYENGAKTKSSGYAAMFIRGDLCDVQLYYRDAGYEEEGMLEPVYMFRDGSVVLGEKIALGEGMAATAFRTGHQDFLQSGRCFEELEVIYLDGVKEGICGGRMDGKELEEVAYTLTDWVEAGPEVTEQVQEQEQGSVLFCFLFFQFSV